MKLDPMKKFEDEIKRIEKSRQEFLENYQCLDEYPVESFGDYFMSVERILLNRNIDVAILAAAVADYGVEPVAGKISSELETLELRLKKNPKVIELVKKWRPEVFQVGFKLMSGVESNELVDTALEHGKKCGSDLTVANSIVGGDFSERNTAIVTPEGDAIPVKISEIGKRLVEIVTQRINFGRL